VIVAKFHENSEIGGFFLDPSEEISIQFLKKIIAMLYGTVYIRDFAEYLKKTLKIPPNRRFIDNLKEFLRKNMPIVDSMDIAEFEFKFFVLMAKLNIVDSTVFQPTLKSLDAELELFKTETLALLKTI